MNTRSTLALFLVFAGLLVAYVIMGRMQEQGIQERAEAKKLFDFKPDDVTSLSITRQAQPPVEALRDDARQWSIVAPARHISPNGPLWTALSEIVASLTNERSIDSSPQSPADYQLDPPLLSIAFTTTDNQRYQIAFGSLDPTQVNRYASMGNGEVFLAPVRAYNALNRKLQDLRDSRLFPYMDEGITGIDFKRHGAEGADDIEDPRLAQRAQAIEETYTIVNLERWRLTKPIDVAANQDKLNALAYQLRFTQGRGYVDEPESLSDYGLDPPYAQLTVHGISEETRTLLLGWSSTADDNSGFFAKLADNPSVFTVDAHLFTLLPEGPGAFREKRLFTREAKQLKTIRYRDPHSNFLLENDADTGWHLAGPAAGDTDQLAVSMYIGYLKRIEGLSFPESDPAPSFGSSRLSLEFTYSDDSPPSTIRIGGPVPTSNPLEFYAMQDIDITTTVSFSTFDILRVAPFDFRVKTLFPIQEVQIQEIDIIFEDRRYSIQYKSDTWTIAAPRGARLETQSDVHSLLKTFVTTLATGIADPPPSPDRQGTDNPILTVRFQVTDNADPGTITEIGPIFVGNRDENNPRQRYVWLDGKETIYLVDQALIEGVRDALRGVIL